ncbi:DUF2026 family protein [Herbaspirillum sp. RV1423]|uniref:DUF2026 family protein n=1 Tax=Herbaspirillum sp. RV1423 TaxID=1443993 RepID=UPI0004B6B880|nr:DUF2026 family protein [Herbaspirillum sp. RV1423]
MKSSNIRPLIPLADYQRIFRVIHSVLDSVDANIPAASFFFSVTAAQILKKFYKKNAFPVAGAAFYLVSADSSGALSFGTLDGDKVDSNSDAFHCWVQCEGYALDFMAPVFQELLAAAGHPIAVPRQMFQKDLTRMSASPDALKALGDFRLEPNLALTRELLQQFTNKPALSNLSQVCMEWYQKPPKELGSDLVMQNAEGEGTKIRLSRLQVTGAW